MKPTLLRNSLLLGMLICLSSSAMDFASKKVVVWKRGEGMGGEEFVAATEEVVDYLATLERPTEILKSIVYSCQVKSRLIAPSLNLSGSQSVSINGHVYINTVYALKDCIKLN